MSCTPEALGARIEAAGHFTAQQCRRILDVSADATPDQLRKAYFVLAKIVHPDKCSGDRSLFQGLAKAYQVRALLSHCTAADWCVIVCCCVAVLLHHCTAAAGCVTVCLCVAVLLC